MGRSGAACGGNRLYIPRYGRTDFAAAAKNSSLRDSGNLCDDRVLSLYGRFDYDAAGA